MSYNQNVEKTWKKGVVQYCIIQLVFNINEPFLLSEDREIFFYPVTDIDTLTQQKTHLF